MPKLNILVLGNLQDSASELLYANANVEEYSRNNTLPELTMLELLDKKDGVISEPLDIFSENILAQCPNLKIISNRAVGYDNVDLNYATERGIMVTNTPGVLDAATADLAMSLLLAVSRRIVEADKYVRGGKWKGFNSDLMLGPDIYGKTLGIVGLGRIGKAFAQRAKAFGLKIIYTRFSKDQEKDKQLKAELGAERVELPELLSNSDFISLHCPYTQNTEKLIGAKEFSLMKPDAILINTARGKIIDQEALVESLEEGKLFGAGLDVFEDEPNVPEALKDLDNVVLTPHIGSACFDTRLTMTRLAIQAILDAFDKKRPAHLINQEAWEKFSGNTTANTIQKT